MMMKNVFLFLLKVLCFNIYFLSFAFAAKSMPLFNLALNWKPEPQFGGFYQAQIDELYKGLKQDVKVIPGGSGTPTIQMLANGKVDAAIVSAEEIVISNARNPKNPVIAVFAVFQTNPQIIMMRADRSIGNLKALYQSPGVIALQSGLTYAQFLKKKHSPVIAKIVPYQGGISYLQKDAQTAQQGFLTSEPIIAEKSGIKVKTFLVADEGFNPYTTVVAVRKSDFDKNPEKIVALTKAVRDGWQNYLKDPSKANAFMAKLNKAMDTDTFQKSAEAQKKLIEAPILGSMTEERWQTLIDQLMDLKVIDKAVQARTQFSNL